MPSVTLNLALSRFGLGPCTADRARSGREDPRSWLLEQLQGTVGLPEPLRGFPTIAEAIQYLPRVQRKRGADGAPAASPPPQASPRAGQPATGRQKMDQYVLTEIWARFRTATTTPLPFRERLVRFWANHFSVSGSTVQILPLIGAYEREAIRPHVTGRFVDLLRAAVLHPAMLSYLDNDRSVGPGSRVGRARGRGLNENLAREVLELHSLGVGGGYQQADVTAFARVLTGHGIDYSPTGEGQAGYRFYPERHEPGPISLLGRRYAEDGAGQVQAVFEDLARHPATARLIATKLARHFLSDQAPEGAVERLERNFRDSGGDLAELARTLLALPEAWQAAAEKFRPPEDWLIAGQRLIGQATGIAGAKALSTILQQLGQPAFRPPSPAGWPDSNAAWLTADALWKRLELAQKLGTESAVDRPLDLAEQSLGEALSVSTREALGNAESAAQAMALLLASPELNRR